MSVQDLYKKFKAGKISKYNFLQEIKRNSNLPWITTLNSLNEVITILKGKNIIWEESDDQQGKRIRKWNDAHMEGGPLEETGDVGFEDDDETSNSDETPIHTSPTPETPGQSADADPGYDPSLAYGHVGNVNEEDDFDDFSDDFPLSMEYDDDPMDAQMIGSPEGDFGFGDDDNPEDQGPFEYPEDQFGNKDGGEFDDEGNELPGEVYGDELQDDPAGPGKWTDPAGGIHDDDEEDPAAMYRENKGVAPGEDGEGEYDVPYTFGEITVGKEKGKRPDYKNGQNSVHDLVDYIGQNPGQSENEIMKGAFGFDRNDSKNKVLGNQKFAYILRRALRKGLIIRDKKIDSGNTKYCYYTPEGDASATSPQYQEKKPISMDMYGENKGSLQEGKTIQLTIDTVNPHEYKRGLNWESGLTYSSVPDWGFNFMDQDKYKKTIQKVLANLSKDPNYYTKKLAGMKTTGKPESASKAYFSTKKPKRHDVSLAYKAGEKNLDKREGNVMKTVGKLEKSNTKDTLSKKAGAGTSVKVKTFKAPGSGGKMKKFKSLKESLVTHFKKKRLTEITVRDISIADAFKQAIKDADTEGFLDYVKKHTKDEIIFIMPGRKYMDNDRFDQLKDSLGKYGYTLSEVDNSDEDRWDFEYTVHRPDVDEAFVQKSPEGVQLDITSDPGGADSEMTTKAKALGVQVKSTKL